MLPSFAYNGRVIPLSFSCELNGVLYLFLIFRADLGKESGLQRLHKMHTRTSAMEKISIELLAILP